MSPSRPHDPIGYQQQAPTPSFPGPAAAAAYSSSMSFPGPAPAAAPTTSSSFPALPPSSDPRMGRPVVETSPFAGTDIRTMRLACEFSLREYITLSNKRRYDDPATEDRIRAQSGIAVSDLQTLRREVGALVKEAEAHRWRRWILGGIIAALIPAVRRLFRRSSKDTEANDTEHAFVKSKSLIARILDSVRGKGRLASVAFFVLAVLYIFSNEVSLRVGRTVVKRLKKLTAKVDKGVETVGEEDMKILSGWRWRVLLW
ncbi:hypothetical protein F4778DRAFT_383932 [Xylariomycetidae sp. FL2044]|nr:hypothetical protein F4778DRAFT_383932 [Xylariomycetidae sp. FL2044]